MFAWAWEWELEMIARELDVSFGDNGTIFTKKNHLIIYNIIISISQI